MKLTFTPPLCKQIPIKIPLELSNISMREL